MADSQELLEFLYTASVGMARTDPEGKVLFMNPLLANILMVVYGEHPAFREMRKKGVADPGEMTANLLDFLSVLDPDIMEAQRRGDGGDGKKLFCNHDIFVGTGTIKALRVSCVKLARGHLNFTVANITDHWWKEELPRIQLRLGEFAAAHSPAELLRETLDELGTATGSPIGFFHFLEGGGKTISLQAWSTRTEREFCHIEGSGMQYPLGDAGVWADAVRLEKPVIHNDYRDLPHRRGLPEGHAPVNREMVAPVFREGRVEAILGLGNKPTPYTEEDVNLVSAVADIAWELARRRMAEAELKSAYRDLQIKDEIRDRILDAVAEGVVLVNGSFEIEMCNQTALDLCGFRSGSVLGKKCHQVFGNDLCRTDGCPLKRVMGGESEIREETALRCLSGEVIPVSFTAKAIIDAGGNRMGMVESFLDLREIRAREESARNALELRALSEGYARMSAMLLHNLGNLFTPVQIEIERMQGEEGTSGEDLARKCYEDLLLHRDHLARYVTQDERGKRVFSLLGKLVGSLEEKQRNRLDGLGALSGNLLRISRLLTLHEHYDLQGEEKREPLDLNVMLEESLLIHSMAVPQEEASIQTELSPNLPPVRMDRKRLRFLLNELIRDVHDRNGENDGPEPGRATVARTTAEDGRAVLEICCGLREVVAPDLETELPDSLEALSPSGLNRYYCKRIVESAGGNFQIINAGPGSHWKVRVRFGHPNGS